MAFPGSKKSFLERRLKELRKESEVVGDDIRSLVKVVRNPGQVEKWPDLKSPGLRPVPAPNRRDPVQQAPEPSAAAPQKPHAEGELFGWGHGASQAVGGRPPPKQQAAQQEPAQASRSTVSSDQRFAQYFSSTSFLGGKPLRQEKNVQRNKAVFMVGVVIIVFFIVYQLMSK